MAERPLGNVAEDRYEQEALLGGGMRYETPLVKQAAVDIRQGFVRKVYGILTAQMAITVAIAYVIWKAGKDRGWLRSHEWLLWLSVGMTFVTILVMACFQSFSRRYPNNYIFLIIFTVFESVLVGFISAMFTWQSVLLAAGVTVAVFFCLTLYAFGANHDFTGAGPYLFASLVVLLLFGIVMAVLPAFGLAMTWTALVYNILGVIIFSFFIIFDTQLMLGEWGGHRFSYSIDEYCFAALNLYMDVLNLFLHLLSLLGDGRDA